jgi:hypothetical protein
MSALLLMASLVFAESAGARIVAAVHPAHATLEQGPSVEAGVVTWMDSVCSYCEPLDLENEELRYRVHASYPGGRHALLARGGFGFGGSGPNSGGEGVQFFGSSSHLALEREVFGTDEFEGDFGSVTLSAGAFGARQRRIFRCEQEEGWPSGATALHGTTLAYDGTPCSETSALAVLDVVTGERWELALPERAIRALDVDGRFLAVATARSRENGVPADRVTVYDVDRREARYAAELPQAPAFASLDVGPDGSLAVRGGTGGTTCGDTVTIRDPAGEPTSSVAACGLIAQLAGETVVVAARRGRRQIESVAPGATRGGALVWLGMVPLTSADADEDDLALALPDCTGRQEIRLEPLMTLPIGLGQAACPAAFSGSRLPVSADARVTARGRCRRGCRGVLRVLSGRRTVAARAFWARPGGIAVRARVRPWARHRVAAGPLGATARLTTWDRAGRRSVVSRPVTLSLG